MEICVRWFGLSIASGSRTGALVSDYSFKDKRSTGQKARRLAPPIELQLASHEAFDQISLGSPPVQFRCLTDSMTYSPLVPKYNGEMPTKKLASATLSICPAPSKPCQWKNTPSVEIEVFSLRKDKLMG